MVNWKDYLRQSQLDRDACLLHFDKGHYGLSAYFMQQALEKRAKVFLFQHELAEIPLKRHTPLLFIEKIPYIVKRIEEKARQNDIPFQRGQFASYHDAYIEQCINIRKNLYNEDLKRAVWKNSLNIALDSQEEDIFKDYSYFRKYYRFNLTEIIDLGNDVVRSQEFMNRINSETDTQNGSLYKAIATYARMLVATFPHEDFGRYPTDISVGGKAELTDVLYERHKADLKEMIDVVLREIPASALVSNL